MIPSLASNFSLSMKMVLFSKLKFIFTVRQNGLASISPSSENSIPSMFCGECVSPFNLLIGGLIMFSKPRQYRIALLRSSKQICCKVRRPSTKLLLPEPLSPISTVSGVNFTTPLFLIALKFLSRKDFSASFFAISILHSPLAPIIPQPTRRIDPAPIFAKIQLRKT